jgi:hypothetical protein
MHEIQNDCIIFFGGISDVTLSSCEMAIGWLMLWLVTKEVKCSIPFCDTLLQSLQLASMPKGLTHLGLHFTSL